MRKFWFNKGEDMDAVSSVLINKALDGLSMRMAAIAENVANMQTADYQPLRVSFEDALMEAKKIGPEAVQNVNPQLERKPISEQNGEVRIGMELAAADATSARYGALIDILNRQMQLSRTVVRGGQ